ncbi:MAG: hypothetical protein CMF50_08680 [Legionellales bacterium]|nr:hypothetical protein [Legionellales bacterium]|tara:strand:- start:16246 stop:16716 length:471 start_codon:yes stop_codon:yes gene_type:complete
MTNYANKRNFFRTALLIIGYCVAQLAFAANTSPVGRWQTIDDGDNKPRSIVKINESNGVLSGNIEKIYYRTGEGPSDLCSKCTGERHNKPFIGMNILWGLTRYPDGQWKGGKIIDPESGNTYRCKLQVSPDGKTMTVRGYLGVSLLGRDQTWLRVS